MKLTLAGLLFGAVLACGGTATAASISIDADSCGSCQGLDLDLEIIDNGGTFDVTLKYTAPTGFGTGNSYTSLVQAGFGAIQGWTSVSVDSITFGAADVSGDWSDAIASNVSSSGLCSGPVSGGKVCLKGFTDLAGGGELIFSFTVTGGTLKSDTEEWHIGGQVTSPAVTLTGNPRGLIISETGPGTPIPEPTAALTFAIGALVVGGATRRRR